MTNMRWLMPGLVAAITFAACSSKDALLEVRDGAADASSPADAGLGGARVDAATGVGGATGSGGATTVSTGGVAQGTGGASGRGGAGPGTGGLGTGGGGGVAKIDGAMADSGSDAASRADGGDAVVECSPGYPVGSTRETGDCNTCICVAGGAWACSTHVCPPDAGRGPEAPADSRAIDASGLACSQVSTQADCQARSDCHAVFADDLPCGCATPGCCMRFVTCVAGPADCVRPTQFSCTIAEMACPDPYLLSYRAACPEGCVLASDCP